MLTQWCRGCPDTVHTTGAAATDPAQAEFPVDPTAVWTQQVKLPRLRHCTYMNSFRLMTAWQYCTNGLGASKDSGSLLASNASAGR